MDKKISKSKAKNKDYFEIIFISASLFLFLVLIFSVYFLKNSLYQAKDQASLDFLNDYQENLILEGSDPFVAIKESSFDEKNNKPQDNNLDPSLGPKDAKVKIFFFSDFSCPFCFDQENIIKKVYDKFKEDVRIIWKDYPDASSLNSFSFQASKAARCANEQNKFWDYNKLLYKQEANFSSLKNDLFLELAKNLQLDINSFSNCLLNPSLDSLILNNVSEAESLGIPGIPYIYINNNDFLGDLSEEELESLINSELENLN